MVKYSLIFFLMVLSSCKNQDHLLNKGTIEFGHIGMTDRIYVNLVISTDNMKIQLNDRQINMLKVILNKANITEQDKEDYIQFHYELVKTDVNTFTYIQKFMFSHKEYYMSLKKDSGEGSYAIFLQGKRYGIYPKLKDNYLKDLESYLRNNNCDKKVIEEISHL